MNENKSKREEMQELKEQIKDLSKKEKLKAIKEFIEKNENN